MLDNSKREFLVAVEDMVVTSLMRHGSDDLREWVFNFINVTRPFVVLKSERLEELCQQIRGESQDVIDWLMEMNWEIVKLAGSTTGIDTLCEIYSNAGSASPKFMNGYMDNQITDRIPTLDEAKKNIQENVWVIPLMAAFAIDLQAIANEKAGVSN